jgi:5-methylcytosine-specific restriction protein A
MSLKDITRESVLEAVAEYDRTGQGAFLTKYGFRPSLRFVLRVNGKAYDSKAILGAAHGYATRDGPLTHGLFSGGEAHTKRVLKRLGFEVEKVASREAPPLPAFELERLYNRQGDIHDVYGGSERGGIAPSAQAPLIFIFSGKSGEAFGYLDKKGEDGVFRYTGEGQRGPMTFKGGNKAVRDHALDGKDLHLFMEDEKSGLVRYKGQFYCPTWEYGRGLDKDRKDRQTIVFHLVPVSGGAESEVDFPEERARLSALSDAELRDRALEAAAAPQGAPKESRRILYRRSETVRVHVLRRAKGTCEACGKPAPFQKQDGTPYLEPHHTRMVSDGGPDHPRWVGAICPTCHRHIHFGQGGHDLNMQLQARLGELEPDARKSRPGQSPPTIQKAG